jgi:hypothetical protein
MAVPKRSGSKRFKIKLPAFDADVGIIIIRTLGCDDATALVALRFNFQLICTPLICQVAGDNELEERIQMTPVART